MKKTLRALALSAFIAFSACSVTACSTFGDTGKSALITSEKGTAVGYDLIAGFATKADELCVDGTISHEKCVEVKNYIHKAKAIVDGTWTAEQAGKATDPVTQAALLAQLVGQIKTILGE